jgi:hypothetical protein
MLPSLLRGDRAVRVNFVFLDIFQKPCTMVIIELRA